ncbi:MAG: T6SS immunity protein Tli4 family protein, partial [Proteobacteria bacterium]|nr:T6SS immunity protein Tli4 family protein [Pseudomonadota bacterium]
MVKKKPFWLAVLAFIVLVGAVKIFQPSPYHPDRTPKMDNIPPKIEALFKSTKPVCFGRFIIDVPEKAKVVWGTATVPYDLEVYPDQGHIIKAEIKAKIDKITEEKHRSEPSMLKEVIDSVNSDSKIVVGYENFMSKNLYQLYSYIRLDKTAFVQSIPSALIKDEAKYKRLTEELLSIARRLRLRAETEIPDEQGICIEEGFIPFPLDYDHEVIRVGFRFPEVPDVTFSIETYSMSEPSREDTLASAWELGQEAASSAGQSRLFARIKKLRWGDRVIGQWEGAEGLMRLPSDGLEPETHEFQFKTPGVGKDLLRPAVTLKL